MNVKRRNVVRLAIAAGLVVVAAIAAGASADRSSVDQGGYGPGGAAPREAWAWTQLISDPTHPGQVTQARLVTPEPTCPIIAVTTGTQTDRHRMVAESVVSQYPTNATVCTWRVPVTATAARVDRSTTNKVAIRPDANGSLPLPTWGQGQRPENIALIGDTGCRITAGGTDQVCKNPQSWPFRDVANSAATDPARPDLVIHAGDYVYRSRPTDEPTRYCGDQSMNARTWGCLVADFFQPAQRLLARAPFVFVRGNHETCGRNGAVWFRYLANQPSATACEDYSPPLRVDAGRLGLLVMDTSCASDEENPPSCDVSRVQSVATAQFNQINNTLAGQGDDFLLTHDPIWTVDGETAGGNPEWIDHRLGAAITATGAGMLSAQIRLVLSGHVHLYQMLDFGGLVSPRRPPQITVGSSGTELDRKTWTDANLVNRNVDGQPIGHLITHSEFGYVVLHDTASTWNLRFFDRGGKRVAGTNCNLVGAEFPNCV
jgi:3',5'-cyclic AMP phosphodiesterase CpdA